MTPIRFPKVETNQAHIYIVQSRDGLMKVGSSAVPEARAIEVSWMNGGKANLLWYSPRTRYAVTAERRCHAILTTLGYHVKGEWFDCSAMLAKRVIERSIDDVMRALEAHTKGRKGKR